METTATNPTQSTQSPQTSQSQQSSRPAKTDPSARYPLSAFSKLAIVAFLGGGLSLIIFGLSMGIANGISVIIPGIGLLIFAGLAVTGLRWMPILLTALCLVFLSQVVTVPYIAYNWSHPRPLYFNFLMDSLAVAFVLLALGANIGAITVNYRKNPQPLRITGFRRPAFTGLVLLIAGLFLGALFVGAMAQPVAATATQYTNGVPTVHMSAENFTQPTVTISTGSKLLLVDDVAVEHILANGSWQNGKAAPAREPGAPVINNVQVNDDSVTIGPFATAGTYHIYCMVHPGMELTVIVQ